MDAVALGRPCRRARALGRRGSSGPAAGGERTGRIGRSVPAAAGRSRVTCIGVGEGVMRMKVVRMEVGVSLKMVGMSLRVA